MRCPFCRVDNDRVIDSRVSQDGFAIRRRRECSHCKRRFNTYERLEEMEIKVVKKNNVREPFDREKIRSGLAKACWKRPVSDEQIEQIVSQIESDVYATGDSEIDSHLLGEMVMQRLGAVDRLPRRQGPTDVLGERAGRRVDQDRADPKSAVRLGAAHDRLRDRPVEIRLHDGAARRLSCANCGVQTADGDFFELESFLS